MKQKPFSIIAACDDEGGLGKNGDLAWRLSADLKYFKALTTSVSNKSLINAVVMGRRTWESLPEKFRPLPNRMNMVLTRQTEFPVPNDVLVADSLSNALAKLSENDSLESIFVIGGAHLYAQAVTHIDCQNIYLTRIIGKFDCDVFFPSLPVHFKCIKQSNVFKENGISYSFVEYSK